MGYETTFIVGQGSTWSDEIGRINDNLNTFAYPQETGEGFYGYGGDEETRHNDIKHIGRYNYIREIARIDMCKICYDGRLLELDSKSTVDRKFYAFFGNEPRTHDNYGNELRVHSVKDVITAIKEAMDTSQYRRYSVALAMLVEIDKSFDDAIVLFHGH
jgi:hypothetical protein